MKNIFSILIISILSLHSYSNISSNWAYKITYGIEDNFNINNGIEESYLSDVFSILTNEYFQTFPEELTSENIFSDKFDESRTNTMRWVSFDFGHFSNTFSSVIFRTVVKPDPKKEMSWNDVIDFYPSLMNDFQRQDIPFFSTNGIFQYEFYQIDLGNGGSTNDVEFLSTEDGKLTYNYFTNRYLRNSYFDYIWETSSEPSLAINGAELIIDFSNFTAHEVLGMGNGNYQNLNIMSKLNSSKKLDVRLADDTSWDFVELYFYTNIAPKLQISKIENNHIHLNAIISSSDNYKVQKTENLTENWVDILLLNSMSNSFTIIEDMNNQKSFYRIISSIHNNINGSDIDATPE